MNAIFSLSSAIKRADDSWLNQSIKDSAAVNTVSFMLVNLQPQLQQRLDSDQQKAIQDATAGNTQMASYDQGLYQTDSQIKDTQSGIWENAIAESQAQLTSDSDGRKANISLVQGMARELSVIISLFNKFLKE